jgi:hypothetical protein
MKRLFIASLISLALNACVTPVNLQFENASTLKKGEIEVGAAGSIYTKSMVEAIMTEQFGSPSFGAYSRFGVSDFYNLKLRMEYMSTGGYVFFEADNKVRLLDKRISFSFPFQYYYDTGKEKTVNSYQGDMWVACDGCQYNNVAVAPRFNFSFYSKSEQFDFTAMPKLIVVIEGSGWYSVLPALSLGAGYTSPTKAFSIRPEVGYSFNLLGGSFSGGIAVGYKLR